MLSDKINSNISARELLLTKLGQKPLIFDGGMGSQLQARGLVPGELPEAYNLTHPDIVTDIHREYLASGSSCILTNTFGSNRYRLEESPFSLKEIITAAIQNGRSAIALEKKRCIKEGIEKDCFLFLDMGPIGQLIEPMGTLSFDDAYETFKEQVLYAGDQIDAILIETISDLYEMKAAVLAVKENSDLPVFATMTFEANRKTLMGASPAVMVAFLEGIGVDALGVNCSLGPKEIAPIVEEILSVARIPVIVQPNAGLPTYSGNKTTYNVTVDEFASYIQGFIRAGVSAVGGCCGTTPDYIRSAALLLAGETVRTRFIPARTRITSGSRCVTLGDRVVICGERLNPTGKKKLREALLHQRYEEVLHEAIYQEQAGADVLDVNVGLPGIDEAAVMSKVIRLIQEIIQLPLQIDSSSPAVLEKACRIYNGKPLINSVNGKKEVMEAVFPIVKKYGGVVLGLTLDEDGIPLMAEGRLAIARRIVETAESYGIDRSDVIIDCLVLTASAQQKEVMETLKALALVKSELGVHTVLGCSNVSFGLPNRPLINKTFMAMALSAGLDLPIMNPLDRDLMATVDAYEVLSYKDIDSARYIQRHAADQAAAVAAAGPVQSGSSRGQVLGTGDMSLVDMVVSGMKAQIEEKTREVLKTSTSMQIINEHLIPGLNEVGKKYDSGHLFLPQLILSAETAKLAFGVIKETFPVSEKQGKGPILMATVEGDIHDIGKNIVRVILESYGYQVIDLGKDVPVEKVVDAFLEYKPRMIGLSALMTTTVYFMEKTIMRLKEQKDICPIMVGGAVLTVEVAREIGADHYCKDALEAVELAQKLIRN
ncbi:MAG: homocysteine S-methyltransferase family protein [Eubacteriales bacterium]